MDLELVASLTARERQCLQLVAQGYSSKEIARQLDRSVHSVNEWVTAATHKLGADSRRSAARMLRGEEPDPKDLGPQSLGIVAPAELLPLDEVEQGELPGSMDQLVEVRDGGLAPAFQPWPIRLPFRRRGERSNGLSWAQSLFWVPILALLLAALVGLILSELDTLSRLRGASGSRSILSSTPK